MIRTPNIVSASVRSGEVDRQLIAYVKQNPEKLSYDLRRGRASLTAACFCN
jgi:hypothetical protein